MSPEPLPEDIRAFVSEHIRSLRGLEMLLVLQDDAARDWTAGQLSSELRAAPQWAEAELQFFAERGLLARSESDPDCYRYAPTRLELANAVTALSALYPARRFSIIEVIFSAPSESVRRFSDAFRLRKEKPDG